MLVQCNVDLACAKNHTINLFWSGNGAIGVRWVGDDPFEGRLSCKVLYVGTC